jgi:hypothetical protein
VRSPCAKYRHRGRDRKNGGVESKRWTERLAVPVPLALGGSGGRARASWVPVLCHRYNPLRAVPLIPHSAFPFAVFPGCRSEAERLKKELAETTLVNSAQAEDILAVRPPLLARCTAPALSCSRCSPARHTALSLSLSLARSNSMPFSFLPFSSSSSSSEALLLPLGLLRLPLACVPSCAPSSTRPRPPRRRQLSPGCGACLLWTAAAWSAEQPTLAGGRPTKTRALQRLLHHPGPCISVLSIFLPRLLFSFSFSLG